MPALRQSDDPEQRSPFGALVDERQDPPQPESQLDDEMLPEERLEAKTVIIGDDVVRKGNRQTHEPPPADQRPPRREPAPAPQDDEGVTELKRQLSFQQQATARATQAAQAEYQARMQAERGLNQSNVSMIEQAIENANQKSEEARQVFQAALERGDHATASKAQIAISDARANLLRLQEMREGVANQQPDPRPRAPQPPPTAAQPPQQQQLDPTQLMQRNVNALGGHLDRTGFPKSAAWIRAHPEMVRDKAAIDIVDGAHNYAVNGLNLVAETDAYFDALEAKIEEAMTQRGMAPPNGATRRELRAPPPVRAIAAPARSEAPSLRTGNRRGGTAVSLTARQREHARDVLGMSDEEYAAELLDGQDRGRVGGNYGNSGAGYR